LKSTIFGIDLAKNIIQLCEISKHNELVSHKSVNPQQLKELLAKEEPAIVALKVVGAVIVGDDMLRVLTMMFGSLVLKK